MGNGGEFEAAQVVAQVFGQVVGDDAASAEEPGRPGRDTQTQRLVVVDALDAVAQTRGDHPGDRTRGEFPLQRRREPGCHDPSQLRDRPAHRTTQRAHLQGVECLAGRPGVTVALQELHRLHHRVRA
ncbi:hypothetical protein ACWGJX_42975, partial [Streptomyces sp. NPDC054775]